MFFIKFQKIKQKFWKSFEKSVEKFFKKIVKKSFFYKKNKKKS